MDWKTVKRLETTPFFHYASYVLIGVALLAQLYLSLHSYLHGLRFPQALVIGFSASLFFVSSTVVYHHFCPPIVKEYPSAEAYAKDKQETYKLSQAANKFSVVLANLEETEEDVRAKLIELQKAGQQAALNTKVDELYPMTVQRFLLKQYERECRERKFVMWVAAVLYGFGFLLAMYIMVERVLAVYRAAVV